MKRTALNAFVPVVFFIFCLSCRKDYSQEGRPVPQKTKLVGWTTTRTLLNGTEQSFNISFRIDTPARKMYYRDTLLGTQTHIFNFSPNWILQSVYQTLGPNLRVDSFERDANGRLLRHLILGKNNTLFHEFNITQDDLGDSIRVHARHSFPVDPDYVEGDQYHVIHKFRKQVLSFYSYARRKGFNYTDSSVAQTHFTYDNSQQITGMVHHIYRKATGLLNETQEAFFKSENEDLRDRGDLSVIKQLDNLLFTNDLAWLRRGSEWLPQVKGEESWNQHGLFHSKQVLEVKTTLNGVPNGDDTYDYTYHFLKDELGRIVEIRSVLNGFSADPLETLELKITFHYK